MSLVAALIGAGFAAGVLLIVDGWLGRDGRAGVLHASRTPLDGRRLAIAAASAALVLIVTRWPVAAAGAGLAGWYAPQLFGSKVAERRAVDRAEAIATWTEMLRDTLSGAHGLEEAITATASVAPGPIRREVGDLAVRLEREPLSVALGRFGEDLAHPIGDLVVVALSIAAEGSVRELGDLLGTLAVSARDEATMRLQVEASRARLRTAVRVIAGCTAMTALGLILFNRGYLDVYETPTGQAVLLVVAGCWGAGLWALGRMGRLVEPERFLAGIKREEGEA